MPSPWLWLAVLVTALLAFAIFRLSNPETWRKIEREALARDLRRHGIRFADELADEISSERKDPPEPPLRGSRC